MSPRPSLALRAALTIVRLASRIVPRRARSDWRREWESELHHGSHRPPGDLLRRSLGTLPDAAWIRRQFTADADVVHDVRHATRLLASSPGFTATAIVILAIGIGGTLSIGAMVDTLWLRTLPYHDAERVVTLWQRDASGLRGDVAPANFLDWRERSRSFAALAAVVPYSYDFTGAGEPEVAFGAQITEGFFDVIGTTLLLGRQFLADEHRQGAGRVVIITEGLWRRRFAADPAIVGKSISLDGNPITVVGVLPRDFRPQLLPRPGGGELSVWTPKVIQDHETRTRGSAWWNVIGRLAPGVSLDEARSEMQSIAGGLAREYPRTNEHTGIDVVPLREHLMGSVRVPLLVMFGAIITVLLIGCANVANLLLARAASRGREFAIRTALGAGRTRIVRQLMVESLLLASLGAAAGIALAHWLLDAIVTLAPPGVLRLEDATLDGRMVAFAVLLTAATAVGFGLLPAVQSARGDADVVRDRAPRVRASFRRLLVAGEVALAIVLLVGAAMLLRSFDRLLSVDPGFSARNTVALQVFAYDRNPTADRLRVFFRTTLQRIEALPAVEAVGAVSAMPFAAANIDIRSPLRVVGRSTGSDFETQQAYVTVATPGYFEALSIPLREGRLLETSDTAKGPTVAVVSEALSRREWGERSPMGERIQVQWHGQSIEAEVVGVVAQVRHDGLDRQPRAEAFFALEQVPFGSMTYVVRGQGDPSTLIAAARQAVWSVDPLQTFYETGQVERMVASTVVQQRFTTLLLASFAMVALALCVLGVYGVISFAAAQRTREIGVRMALGADRASIRRLVLREGAAVVAAGVAVGLPVALVSTRVLRTMLFEAGPVDPVALLAATALLSLVALMACYVPAHRATRVDPVRALRAD
jgi:putative ABC transport system permease protein